MSATSQALIHFVGLVVFTMQPPADAPRIARPQSRRGLVVESASKPVAILPAVTRHDGDMSHTERVTTGGRPSVAELAAGIQTHTALIAYKNDDYLDSKGWEPAFLWNAKEKSKLEGEDPKIVKWDYIALSGERITFLTGVDNLPISKFGALPHITDEVGQPRSELAPGYKPPYALAAAVIDLPGGTFRPCTSGATNVVNRTDAELWVENSGRLTISGGPGKYLTLKGGAQIFVANVPQAYATHTSFHDSPGHFVVYCAMLNGTFDRCDGPHSRSAELPAPTPCSQNGMVTIGSGLRTDPGDSGPFSLMTFECSNSQWP